jgi:hypothetical protein
MLNIYHTGVKIMKTLYVVARTQASEKWTVETYADYDSAKALLKSIEETPDPTEGNPTFFYEPMSQEYFERLEHQNFFAILKVKSREEI